MSYQGLDIVSLRLRYDPAVMWPLTCTLNSSAFQAGGCNLDYAAGQIRLTLLAGTGAGIAGRSTGVVKLADIRFQAVGQPGDLASLILTVDQLAAAGTPAPNLPHGALHSADHPRLVTAYLMWWRPPGQTTATATSMVFQTPNNPTLRRCRIQSTVVMSRW